MISLSVGSMPKISGDLPFRAQAPCQLRKNAGFQGKLQIAKDLYSRRICNLQILAIALCKHRSLHYATIRERLLQKSRIQAASWLGMNPAC
jgi:hypothetical protein